jgi:hypothetical protein
LITVWMRVVWPNVNTLRTVINTWGTWTVPVADSVCCAHVGWEINRLITSETASFFCVCPANIYIYIYMCVCVCVCVCVLVCVRACARSRGGARSIVVDKALCYKPEGRWFDTSMEINLSPAQPKYNNTRHWRGDEYANSEIRSIASFCVTTLKKVTGHKCEFYFSYNFCSKHFSLRYTPSNYVRYMRRYVWGFWYKVAILTVRCKQDVLERLNHLFSFDTTRTVQKTSRTPG